MRVPTPGSNTGTSRFRTVALATAIAALGLVFGSGPAAAADPTLTTQASASGFPAGGDIFDFATLGGVDAPTGTIMFDLFGPDNATCSGPPIFTSIVPVNGNGNYQSAPFTTSAAGTYGWLARYSGDVNNTPVTTACDDPAETTEVAKRVPTLNTQASQTSPGTIIDTATLGNGAGPAGPTGTMTFDLFGPDNLTCAGFPIFTSIVPVGGNGTYTSAPFQATAPGTYVWVVSYSGDASNLQAGAICSDPLESVVVTTVIPAPTLATLASPSVHVGNQITDTATLSEGVNPTGTINFQLFGPDDATCTGPPIFSNTKPVAGNGPVTSDPFTPAVGVYRWVATYSGDANNAAVATACNDLAEAVSVTRPVLVSLTTTASPSIVLGGQITDTATLSGGVNPTGTITFRLVGRTCGPGGLGPAIFTSIRPVAGNGPVTSEPFTPVAPGVYMWEATYSGDPINGSASTSCDPAEMVTVTPLAPVTPTLTTYASPAVGLGGQITDSATLSGGVPTGTITFRLFGPDDATCTGPPIFSNTQPVIGSAFPPGNLVSATSDPFTPPAVGVFRWVATYSGDPNNAAVASACNDPAEAVTVTIRVDKSASPATLPEPGGTVTFTVSVANGNGETQRLVALEDDVHGSLAGRGTCGVDVVVPSDTYALLPPGGTYSCSFTAEVTGNAGASETDTVYASVSNEAGTLTTTSDSATVTITNALPSVAIAHVVDPPSRPEQGGAFTHSITVTNTGAKRVSLAALVDSVYGDLVTRTGSSCITAAGAVLEPGAAYSCSFTATFTGEAGATQTDTVAVTAVDDEGSTSTASAPATVSLVDVPPRVGVDLAVTPESRPAPGGSFTFTVTVRNLSNPEAVTILSLVSDVHGNLDGRGSCRAGITLAAPPAPGDTVTCSFVAPFTGDAGARLTTTVTAVVEDNEGTAATAAGTRTIVLTEPVPVPPDGTPTPGPRITDRPGLLAFTGTGAGFVTTLAGVLTEPVPVPPDGTPTPGPRITDRPGLLAFTGTGAGFVTTLAGVLLLVGTGMVGAGRRRLAERLVPRSS